MTREATASALREIEDAIRRVGSQLAVYLVYEHPSQVIERPGLAKVSFAQRCASEQELNDTIAAFRDIGAYVEVFQGERPFLESLVSGRLRKLGREIEVIYSGIGFGITEGGFEPGRMAMLPSIADTYQILCANSDAYTCAFTMHRYHSFLVLRSLGIATAPVWHFDLKNGWMGQAPPVATKIIVKSTYEAWSVGVSDDSVFVVDDSTEERVAEIAAAIGQPVTLQEFVSGREVCLPLVATPSIHVLPPVEQILDKAPGDPDAVLTHRDNLGHSGLSYVPFVGSEDIVRQMASTAKKVFRIFQQRALGRMDFRIDEQGRPWLTDVAITPGLSTVSSTFASFTQFGFTHSEFLRIVLGASLASAGKLNTQGARRT